MIPQSPSHPHPSCIYVCGSNTKYLEKEVIKLSLHHIRAIDVSDFQDIH